MANTAYRIVRVEKYNGDVSWRLDRQATSPYSSSLFWIDTSYHDTLDDAKWAKLKAEGAQVKSETVVE